MHSMHTRCVDVQVGAAQPADNVHDHALLHLGVLQSLEHDELDAFVNV